MSYDIVYDRQFIRTAKGFIPMVLIGSNNVWQGNRRAREWSTMFYGERPLFTGDKLTARAEKCCGKEFQEHFKRNGKWVDDNGLRRFVKDGIRDAATVEELRMVYPMEELKCCLRNHSEETFVHYCKTSDEVVQWLEMVDAFIAKGTKGVYDMRFCLDEPLSIGNLLPDRRVIIKSGNFYVSAASKDSVSCSKSRDDARIFNTLQEAAGSIPDWYRYNVRYVAA